MKEFKRRMLPILSLSICAVLIMVAWSIFKKNSQIDLLPDQFVQDKNALDRLLKNSSEIHRIWNEGEDSREWIQNKDQCLKYLNINKTFDESLLRCSPVVLVCNNLFNKNLDYHLIKSDDDSYYRYLTRSNSAYVHMPQSGYLFTLEDNKSHKRLNLLLEDHCQEVYLQNRAYAYGEEINERETEDYRFDNFGQNIYIDRHLTTNAELNEWIDFGNKEFTKGLKKKTGNEMFLPATQLLEEQMNNFCSFKGKQLLMAHYFDAATFLPMDLTDLIPKKNNRSPYYWTKKKSEFKKDCNLVFAKECLAKPFRLNSSGPTWAGLMDPMGGVFELMRNPIDPESNLKASSFYFNFPSPWHKLGFRAGWDGEGFDLRHFDFKGINPDVSIEKFQVGFRCMRESK
jgi:hypothetical protein